MTFTREAFSSAPDQVMAFRFTADKPGSISFTAALDRMERFETVAGGPNELLMTGKLSSGVPDVDGLMGSHRQRLGMVVRSSVGTLRLQRCRGKRAESPPRFPALRAAPL